MPLTMKVVCDHVPGLAGFGKFLADRDDLSRSANRSRQSPLPDAAPPGTPANVTA